MQERLGCLTNKCMDSGASDLEYYVQESAHILGLQEHAHDAKVQCLCMRSSCMDAMALCISVHGAWPVS